MKDFNKIIGKEYIAQWLCVRDYGRLVGQTITINSVTPKNYANITINLPDGKKINKRVKLKRWSFMDDDDSFMIDSTYGDDIQIQCYHNFNDEIDAPLIPLSELFPDSDSDIEYHIEVDPEVLQELRNKNFIK